MTAPTESSVLFREKLTPAWWIWLIAAGFSAAWILVFQPVSLEVGVVVAVILFIALAILLIISTPEITVTPSRVRAGRASIEPRFLADAVALHGGDATKARGTEFNALSYLCLRGWVQPLVSVKVTDPQDPTPSWLISSRRPEELAEAINRATELDRQQA